MKPAIEFTRIHRYTPSAARISLPVALASGGRIIDLVAFVDTGAGYCLFETKHGEMPGINIEAGEPMVFRTATGRVESFGHPVTIETLGLRFDSVVYFFGDERINRNLLGRIGWLDRIRLGLIDHGGELYLAPRD